LATKKREGSEDSTAQKKKARRPGEERPRIRASHRSAEGKTEGAAVGRGRDADARAGRGRAAGRLAPGARPAPKAPSSTRKAPLAPPRRASGRRSAPPETVVEVSAETRNLALTIAAAGMDKKAIGIEILEVAGKVDYADFLVVMTGRSDRHVQALASGIEGALRQKKIRPLSIEGLSSASWVLIDFGDVVVHVFQEETRQVYDIEGLWIDANRVPVPDADVAESTLR
jgi:ribosome-associated protein